jgi:3-deoxy-D-manno-octulosonate 8-phosphate phosphatase (KDO 8-P phosphatase)
VIKLVILDIDGILTNGKKYYGLDGMPFAKTYCDKDFTAIKRMRASGVKVCFLSGDDKVNANMAKNRNIDFYYARGRDKVEFVSEFVDIYETLPRHMLYLGDDLFDLNIMKAVGHAYCPEDSPQIVKESCEVIPSVGGENLVCKLVDILLKGGDIIDAPLEAIEELDKKENF